MKKLILSLFCYSSIFPQVSLYQGRNPYINNYNDGEIIRIHVNSSFAVTINGEWNRNLQVNLKLLPDKKNLPFLNASEESRNNNRQNKERQNVSEKFKFILSAIVTRQPDGNYRLNANKSISVDGKTTRVLCTGLINEKSIINGDVHSDSIADLNLTINSQPQPTLDESYTGEAGEKTEGAAAQTGFSEEQMKKYVIQYMKEVLGALK